ncbi:NAD-dependent epimerase/dehydratase family protein, partial [Eggerthella sinensis]|uniref:NAD-dependent epimerase/dehydratase family protein n=1 Tax=Eggerthella sinensis TaxID=242230 RepID=UPI0022E0AD6C
MKVFVTGAKGFVGRNLVETLKCVRDGKDRRVRYASLLPLEIFEYDRDSSAADLERFCAEADFVFNLAGVNRPKDASEFMEGNFGFASDLLGALERAGNRCPVMLASSAQASLEGRYAGSAYGESKLAGEGLFREHAERTGADVLVYRFPNVFGKWCRPNYNSAVATFCHNVARGPARPRGRPELQFGGGHLLPQRGEGACPSAWTTPRPSWSCSTSTTWLRRCSRRSSATRAR